MIIKNYVKAGFSDARKKALEILNCGVESVLNEKLMRDSVSFTGKRLKVLGEEFGVKGRIFVIGGGKASARMAVYLEKIIGPENITEGLVNCIQKEETERIRVNEASHPYPDERGLAGVREMLALKEKHSMNNNDLVICLISGGGSALMPCPAEGISLADKRRVNEILIKSGADIHEINAVRKHLSGVKGGRLAEHFRPVPVVSVIISDVVGDRLDSIASGMTSFDRSTFREVNEIFEKHGIRDSLPEPVKEYVRRGTEGEIPETPKEIPPNASNFIIGSNSTALEAMKRKAEGMGFSCEIITNGLQGEASEQAGKYADFVKGRKRKNHVFLMGGETTVTIRGEHGEGGRNQEYVTASLLVMGDIPGEWVLASLATDGTDFMKGWAGGIIDSSSLESAREKNLDVRDFLRRHDSHNLLKKINGLLSTGGSTGTNVCDLVVYLFGK